MFTLTPDTLIARLLIIFFCIPVHEWAHCWVASLLGDPTPEREGRLTLNPFVHVDPIGSLGILFGTFGWGRAAQVNPFWMWRVRPRVGLAITAAAGPLANLVLAGLFALVLRLGGFTALGLAHFDRLLFYLVVINVGLALFNLIPIPPLDGSRIVAGFAPRRVAGFIYSLEPYAPYLLLMVVFILPQLGLPILDWILGPLMSLVIGVLLGW